MNCCHICDNLLDSKVYNVKEMYFGTREVFRYQQCASCGCLQIVEFPRDMGKYYPSSYYSQIIKKRYSNIKLLSRLREFRLNAALKHNLASFILIKPHLPEWVSWIRINSKSKIFDVGCGAGQSLLKLRKKGFLHIEGLDPFINETVSYPCGVNVFKKELSDIAKEPNWQDSFDLVMMHHSLEHMPDQHMSIASAHKILKQGGRLLIRIPICSSWAWEHYRENWVQLDAPRHLFLHSLKSIVLLANKHGFILEQTHYDSSEFQFTGSERYLRNIPLTENVEAELFSQMDVETYRQKAIQLNKDGIGDQAGFVFAKSQ